ncbi:hypothetical protein N0V93_010281 [Gnomoniopsis smithogilvyi]|uniref:Uncharacterized protein n=1 Tax=Gnomoniopsis smithogilvyi TaxID=1191159 RepID=A0A9W8YIZ4_9PEZI|nr:hypothetical protein N0V93_010281 [Gnomoniopsis smithogilvyi]
MPCRNYWADTVSVLKAAHHLHDLPDTIGGRSLLKNDYITYQALFDMRVPATHYVAMFSSVRPVVGLTKADMLVWADRHLRLKASGHKAEVLEQVIRTTWKKDFGQNAVEPIRAREQNLSLAPTALDFSLPIRPRFITPESTLMRSSQSVVLPTDTYNSVEPSWAQEQNLSLARTVPDFPLPTRSRLMTPESTRMRSSADGQSAFSSVGTQTYGSQSFTLPSTTTSFNTPEQTRESGLRDDQARRPKTDVVKDTLAARLAAAQMDFIVQDVVRKVSSKKSVRTYGQGEIDLDARAVKALEGIEDELHRIAESLLLSLQEPEEEQAVDECQGTKFQESNEVEDETSSKGCSYEQTFLPGGALKEILPPSWLRQRKETPLQSIQVCFDIGSDGIEKEDFVVQLCNGR